MSRTIKQERTTGSFDDIQKVRKERKLVRAIKADELLWDLKITPSNRYLHAH